MSQTIKINDERIEAVRVRYGLEPSDFWQLPQNKQWCIKHSALEVVAVKENISFDPPMVIEAKAGEGIATICVTGHLGERSIWSIGECSPKNNKNSYPWAMAEKRGIDRVILKLAGIHGLLYSDTEVSANEERAQEASSEPVQAPSVPLKSSAAAKRDGDWEALTGEVDACSSLEELNILVASKPFLEAVAPLPNAWKQLMRDYIAGAREGLGEGSRLAEAERMAKLSNTI